MATSTRTLIESRMQDALEGDPGACFDLGIAHSGEMNRIEAHKWFDLAVQGGYAPAEKYRANVAREMTPRDMAEARRRSRIVTLSHVRQVARFSASLFA